MESIINIESLLITIVKDAEKGWCSIEGCNEKHFAKGFCRAHWQRWYHRGSPTARAKIDPNEFVDCGDYWEIYLYDQQCNHVASAKIDPEDVEKCRKHKWHLDGHGYVVSGVGVSRIFLHRFVMGVDSSTMVDHKYGYKLDSRKSQLRECNNAQNTQNQKLHKDNISGERNVSWNKREGKWDVRINAFNKTYFFGNYSDFDQACQVAKVERDRLHGEFARDR